LEYESQEGVKMTINPIIKIIRAKKLGVLIRDARLKSGKSVEECAQAMGILAADLNAMEFGERAPTLPELELFAYHLEIPLEHFWGKDVLPAGVDEPSIDPEQINKIRQGLIGQLIQNGRNEAKLSIDELAQKTGIDSASLQAYEQGELPVPLPELEILAQELNSTIVHFEDQQGPVGSWFTGQKYVRDFQNLPADLQEFISKPINRPYLEMAVRLSGLRVDKLRALGEGLLEITL
jgi:transcriptional regulator with XRE-family HTH domain